MGTILVTGASGLIGSEVCLHFYSRGHRIHGLDNNQPAESFSVDQSRHSLVCVSKLAADE